MKFINSLSNLYNQYPRQYWLMITGIIIATAGGSMIWPFIVIYASGKLKLPLSTVAALISINAGIGLIASLIAGTLADKIGRKVVMVFSLAVNGIAYLLLVYAQTYIHFAALMVLIGLSNPLYQVGADAMLADIIPFEDRTDAYALTRIANNAAFALGPAAGGFLATRSYNLAFYFAAAGFITYSLLLLFKAQETLSFANESNSMTPLKGETVLQGYIRVFKDTRYMTLIALISLGLIAPTLLWILMPVYTKTHFGILEAQYGWIPTTNAVMCVFIQHFVTRLTRQYDTLPVVGAGMLIYALGVGSVAFMSSFWGFWLSMVILTFGELTLVPTTSKYVADTAPADFRGRYMSIYWLGWGLARTLSPIIGGFLNDNIAPHAIWIGGLLFGLTSVLGIFLFHRLSATQRAPEHLS
jgi:MFS family permease